MNQHEINITFFDWFEEYYEDTKTINMAKNNNQWQTSQGIIIESIHPPFCTIKHIHQENIIKASPIKERKNLTDPINTTDIRNIFEQNNYTNLNLNTIGKQLEKIETLVENKTTTQHIQVSRPKPIENQKSFFKPFEIPKTYHNDYKIDLLQEIQQRLKSIDQSEITQQIPDTPEQSHQSSRTINMMNQQTESEQNSESE